MNYYELKKKNNLIFTRHNIDPELPYQAIKSNWSSESVLPLSGPSWWSRLSGRYRSALEQREYIERGCVDVKLGRIRE